MIPCWPVESVTWVKLGFGVVEVVVGMVEVVVGGVEVLLDDERGVANVWPGVAQAEIVQRDAVQVCCRAAGALAAQHAVLPGEEAEVWEAREQVIPALVHPVQALQSCTGGGLAHRTGI